MSSNPETDAAAPDAREALDTSAATTVTVQLNGKGVSVEPGTSLGAMLDGRGVVRRMIAVEYNGEILRRSEYDDTILQTGDVLEVVQMVGGGA